MSKRELICKMKGYIQPFERRLALMELESVAGSHPVPEPSLLDNPLVYRIATTRSLNMLADTLTYWETIGPATTQGCYTRQVLREATVNVVRNGITLTQLQAILPFKPEAIPIPNRRALRYGPHGAHEYRGKFFPQLVRALLNVAGVKRGDLVLDPMCGSGTTPVEASLLGCVAFGVDMNPLSVLMSHAKCAILTVSPDVLADEYESLKADLLKPRKTSEKLAWFEHLPEKDRAYLTGWFSSQVLADLDLITTRVHDTDDPACRDLFRLCLSNILRRVSWQKEADLRVRKEVRPDADIDAIAEFVNELGRTVRTVLAFLYEERALELGPAQIIDSDARTLVTGNAPLAKLKGKVKVIVTSPPYATALPYLDTDRLSLSYLGLLSRPDHRVRDYEMIGNRELTENRRRAYWKEYQQHKNDLPCDVTSVIDQIHALNEANQVGFRRRNLPALLARYFLDMRQVFQSAAVLLKPGGAAYVVIGNNHTIAGGQHIDIETDRLLGSMGQSIGLTLEQTIPMEMLVSRDIFKNNAVASETILCFRK
jgi:DNA modification methylase